MERKKTCVSCKYFLRHYVRHGVQYMKIGCGHCINLEIGKEEREKRENGRKYSDCAYWEEAEKEDTQKKIREVLRNMEKKLEEIAGLLKEDEE